VSQKKIAIVMATGIEANPFIEGLNLKLIQEKPFKVFSDDFYYLIISGIGKANSAMATEFLYLKFDVLKFFNLGAAGSVVENVNLGDIFLIDKLFEPDRPNFKGNLRKSSPEIFDGFATATLATSDRAVVSNDDRMETAKFAELVDMEGAGFLQACKRFSLLGYIFKIVTDVPGMEKDSDIILNIRKTANNLYLFFNDKLLPFF